MNFRKLNCIFLLGIFLLPVLPIVADTLVYDQTDRGKLIGFNLSEDPNVSIFPSSYSNTNPYYASPYQFIGRLDYLGEPTTLTFRNTGDSATGGGASNNKLYFTYLTNGVSHLNQWKEFFLVVTVRGELHNNNHVNHEYPSAQGGKKNKVIVEIPYVLDLPGAGASEEEVAVGEMGYNNSGTLKKRGAWWPNNQYKYKYQYQNVWLDITAIFTNTTSSPFPEGTYITQFLTETANGLSYPFYLVGEYSTDGTISDFLFNVIGTADNPFPFSSLQHKNTHQDSYKVGELQYFSSSDKATLELSSSPNGSEINFLLFSNEQSQTSFPYNVVFNSIKPSLGNVDIIDPGILFDSEYSSTISPIDGILTEANTIEGDIGLYVDAGITPMAGTYHSTIYCILTQTN